MKKYLAMLLSALMLISVSSCNNGSEQNGTTTTTADSADAETGNNTHELVINTVPDTSAEALEYLAQVSPLFAKYMTARRTTPVTLETSINTDDGIWISNVYVKDATHAVQYSVDPAGNEIRVIYDGTMVHQIESATKTVYSQDLGQSFVEDSIKSMLVTLSYSDVSNSAYAQGTGSINGVEYNCESIASGTSDESGYEYSTVYYFDKETDKLVYTKSNETLTTIVKFENSFDRDDLFEVPSDYTVMSVDDLMAQYFAAAGSEASN